MESLLLRLSSLFLLIIALPAFAYVPNYQMYPVNTNPALVSKFKAGYTAPYNKEYVRRVVVGKAKIMPNGAIINIPHGPEFVPSFQDLQHNPKWQVKEPNMLGDLEFSEGVFHYSTTQKRIIDIIFWAAHIADVYTTYEGVKYSCINEANPLLPNVPEISEMVVLKGGVIWSVKTAFLSDEKYGELWWNDWKLSSGILTGLVAYNNHRITQRAKGRCPKR